jgi:dihydroflavonol-4-reductase
MTTVLVLGASGFIGGHIALAAIEKGWAVRGLRRVPGATGHVGSAPIEWFEGNLDRPERLAQAFAGVQVVFHAAGYYPHDGGSVPRQVAGAVAQTRNVIEACMQGGVDRLVYTSSLSTIGRPPPDAGRFADERDTYLPGSLPRSAYYECKYAMESEVMRSSSAELEATVVNPTAVFGPGDVHLALGRALLWVARGWAVVWLPVEVNIVDVRDVAQAQVRASEVGRPGQRYILGGQNLPLREVLEVAARLAGVSPPRVGLSVGFVERLISVLSYTPGMGGLSGHLQAIRTWQGYDCRKAQRELGLNARLVEETLRDALDWFADNGHLKGRRGS